MIKKAYDALSLIEEMIGDDTDLRKGIAAEGVNDEVVQIIYDAREAAGISPVPDDLDFRDMTITQLGELLWELGFGLKMELTPLEHICRNENAPRKSVSKAKRRKTG